MATSKPVTVKLPSDLAEAAELRSRTLGYATLSAYLKGLIRYDLVVQGPHSVSLPMAQKRLDDQDALDARLLAITKRGEGERGQLLAHILQRVKNPEDVGVALINGKEKEDH